MSRPVPEPLRHTAVEGAAPAAAEAYASGVCAVIVTYHPDGGFAARLGAIAAQVGAVIVVDNGSTEAAMRMLREAAAPPAAELIFNHANLGIARALNIGVGRAAARGFRWALLLDQDSRIDADMVATLLAVATAFPAPHRLAVIGSGYREAGDPAAGDPAAGDPAAGDPAASAARPGQPAGDAAAWDDASSVITSGSLLQLATHAAVGPFRDEFFIDHVDTDYCLRARAKGYRVIRTRRAVMSHAIGAPTRHRMLWFAKSTTNHSADRRYYFVRNDTVLLREHGRYAAGLWALKSLSRCLRLCKRVLLYEERKAGKIAAIAHGWWDGVRGNLGPRR